MLFQKRFERARNFQRRQRGLPEFGEDGKAVNEEEPVEVERPEPIEEMEKGDFSAMMAAGCLTVFLPAAVFLIAIVLLCSWLFGLL